MSSELIGQLRETSTSVNLASLQKKDPAVERLLFTAKHVVLYHLAAQQQWSRQDIEGPFFVVQRRTAPYFELVILNRKSISDWRQGLSVSMGKQLETQEKYLYFRADQNQVVALWFHELPDCTNSLQLLTQLCTIANNPPNPAAVDSILAQVQPNKYNNTANNQPNNANVNSKSNKQSYSQPSQPSSTPVAYPSAQPQTKTYVSPYAPPPQVDFNVALPSNVKNDRELAQRLNGFLTMIEKTDTEHARSYEAEHQDFEARKRDNMRRYAEEEKRKKEHEARLAKEERQKKQVASGMTNSPPAGSQPPFPTMLSADQLTMLQSFSSSPITQTSVPASNHTQQTVVSAVPPPAANDHPASAMDRKLAAAKARQASRTGTTSASQASPSLPPQPQSTLPMSLLLAASQSQAPPMPNAEIASNSGARLAPYAPVAVPHRQASPILGPVVSTSPPPQNIVPSTGSEVHPLLAMLNQSVANSSAAAAQQPAIPYSSPYAAAAPVAPTASTPALLTPAHFLASAAPPTASAPPAASPHLLSPQSILSSMNSAAPAPGLMNKADFQQHILSLCNDPATLDWLYQKYLARPTQHPFA